MKFLSSAAPLNFHTAAHKSGPGSASLVRVANPEPVHDEVWFGTAGNSDDVPFSFPPLASVMSQVIITAFLYISKVGHMVQLGHEGHSGGRAAAHVTLLR